MCASMHVCIQVDLFFGGNVQRGVEAMLRRMGFGTSKFYPYVYRLRQEGDASKED